MTSPSSPSPHSSLKKSKTVLRSVIRNFSGKTEESSPSAEGSTPRLKGGRRRTIDPVRSELGTPPSTSFRAASPVPGSPYHIALTRREESPRHKLPRSKSTPRAPQMLASPSGEQASPRTPGASHAPNTPAPGSSGRAGQTTAFANQGGTPQKPAQVTIQAPQSPATERRMRGESSPGRMQAEHPENWLEVSRQESKRFLAQFKDPDSPAPQPGAERKPSGSTGKNTGASTATSTVTTTTSVTLTTTTTSITPANSPLTARTLTQRRRSTELSREHAIVRTPQPEKTLAYPASAAEWVSPAHFAGMARPGQLIVIGFSAVKDLFEAGQQVFGEQWRWPMDKDAPLRGWGQRGTTLRKPDNECEYFSGQKAFEKLYLAGRLDQHFRRVIDDIKKLPPGDERRAHILRLVKQADHVLNLALESLRALTLRTDIAPANLDMHWDALVADKPGRYQLDLMKVYFGDNCATVQAFLNAFIWLARSAGELLTPQTSLPDMLKGFYFIPAALFGYGYTDLQRLKAKNKTDEVRSALKSLGLEDKQLAAWLTEFAHKRKHAQEMSKAAKTVETHEDNAMQKVFAAINVKSMALIYKLGDGDLRILQAAGLASITQAGPEASPVQPDTAEFTPIAEAFEFSPTTSLPSLPGTPTNPDD